MKTLQKLLLFLPVIIILGQPCHAQDSLALKKLKAISKRYIQFSKTYPQEKVYLHFDNNAYYLGETIWFKAYIVRADYNTLSPLSKILYVDLLNSEGYVIETKKIKIQNGQCHGDFHLNSLNYGGYYELRAYTRYMTNFGDETYFSRVVPVFDKPERNGKYVPQLSERPFSQNIPKLRKEPKTGSALNVSFYPEGGNLVANTNSRVAFKATNKSGENEIITGEIYDSNNNKVAELTTDFMGMGSFNLRVDKTKYYAKISCNGKLFQFDLPHVQETGYSIAVNKTGNGKFTAIIQRNKQTTPEIMGLSVTSHGLMYFFETVNMANDSISVFNIPEKLLPAGVCQFTLCNSNGEQISQRQVFVNQTNFLKFDVRTNKETYNSYDQVALKVKITDQNDQAVETQFSLAVHDRSNTSYNPFEETALSNLLLCSELKGYIENPSFYFQRNDAAHQMALDLLMLTQGWTRYSWKQMTSINPFKISQPLEKQLFIEGNIASVLLKRKMKNVDVSMILLGDSTSQQGKCITDSVGEFNFGLKDYYGDAKLILQSKVNEKRKDCRIMLNRNFSPAPRVYQTIEMNPVQKYLNEIAGKDSVSETTSNKTAMGERDHVLKELVVTQKKLPAKISVKYDVAKEMDLMEDKAEWQPTDIYGFLEKTNQYIQVTNDVNGKPQIKYKGKNLRIYCKRLGNFATEVGDDIQDFANTDNSGNQGINTSAFKNQAPLVDEIESVSIIEDLATINSLTNATVVDPTKTVIALVKLKNVYKRMPLGVRNTSFQGYSICKDFYSPQYNMYRLPNEQDYRRTLYWNPDVKTDENGQATVNFYNNSTCKRLSISAETITANGKTGSYNK